jgi:hypothetical protein
VGTVSSNAKAADPAMLGALAGLLLPTVLPKPIGFLDHWTQGERGRSNHLTLAGANGTLQLEIAQGAHAQADAAALPNAQRDVLPA